MADLPEDSEVTQSIISSEEQNYFLNFLPSTEKNEMSIETNTTSDRLLSAGPSSLDEDVVPDGRLNTDDLSANEKIEKLSKQLDICTKMGCFLINKKLQTMVTSFVVSEM